MQDPTPAPSVCQFPVCLRLPRSLKVRNGLMSRASHAEWHLWEPLAPAPNLRRLWRWGQVNSLYHRSLGLWPRHLPCCHPGSSLSFPRDKCLPGVAPTEFPCSPKGSDLPKEHPQLSPPESLNSHALLESARPFHPSQLCWGALCSQESHPEEKAMSSLPNRWEGIDIITSAKALLGSPLIPVSLPSHTI